MIKLVNKQIYIYVSQDRILHMGFGPQLLKKNTIQIKIKNISLCFKQFSAVKVQDEQNSCF